MNPLPLAFLLGLICWVMPINSVVILGIICVALADTRIVPHSLIHLTRFIPMGVLCLRALADLAARRSSFNKTSFRLVKVWVPFFLFALLSTLYSLEPSKTVQRAISGWFVLIGFGVGIPLYFNQPRKMENLLKVISIIMGAAILYSFYSAILQGPASTDFGDYERLHGVFKNPNTLGLLAMQAIFPVIYWWQQKKGKAAGRALFLILVAMGAAILASGSRASALGFFAGLLVFIAGQSRVQRRALPAIWTSTLILMSAFLVVGFLFPEYLGGLFRTEMTSRTVLWKRAWELFRNSPYVGVGFGGSDKLFATDALYLQRIGVYVSGTHSSLMRLLVDLGLLGISLAAYAFFILIHRAWRFLPYFENPKLGVTLFAAIVASLTNSLFESWLFGFGSSATVPCWLFFALLCHQTDHAAVRFREMARDRGAVSKTSFRPSPYGKKSIRPLRV